MRKVPIGDVLAGMAQDMTARNEAQREIHPALIGKKIAGDIHLAMGEAALRPPEEQAPCARVIAKSKKTEIIDPGFHDREVRISQI